MSAEAGSELGGEPCPCGRGEVYGECCGPLHGGAPAPTAERLMRSRYAAFALGLEPYLRSSWHASTRPAPSEPLIDPEVSWLRLAVERVEAGGPFDDEGRVTFTAVGRSAEGRFRQRERSRFVREETSGPGTGALHWFYLDGEALEA